MARTILPSQEKFLDQVEMEPTTGSWIWTGSLSPSGYGQVACTINGVYRSFRAHRVAWMIFAGEIPKGKFILHKCDFRACVNPDHLYVGSLQDNNADTAKRGRFPASAYGLPFGVKKERRKVVPKPYMAQVRYRKKKYHLGSFATAEEAGAAAMDFKTRCYMIGEPHAL